MKRSRVELAFTEEDYEKSKAELEKLGLGDSFINSINNFPRIKDHDVIRDLTCLAGGKIEKLREIVKLFKSGSVSSILKATRGNVGHQIDVLFESLPELRKMLDKGISSTKIGQALKDSRSYLKNKIDELLEKFNHDLGGNYDESILEDDPVPVPQKKQRNKNKIDEIDELLEKFNHDLGGGNYDEPILEDDPVPAPQKKQRKALKPKDPECEALEKEAKLRYRKNAQDLKGLGFGKSFIDAINNGPMVDSLRVHYVNMAAQQMDNLQMILNTPPNFTPQNIAEIIKGCEDKFDVAIEALVSNLGGLEVLINGVGLNRNHLASIFMQSGEYFGEGIRVVNDKINILLALRAQGAKPSEIAFSLKYLLYEGARRIDELGVIHGVANYATVQEDVVVPLPEDDDIFLDDFFAEGVPFNNTGSPFLTLDDFDGVDVAANQEGPEGDPSAGVTSETVEESPALAVIGIDSPAPQSDPENNDFDIGGFEEEQDVVFEEIDGSLSPEAIEAKVLEKFGYVLIAKNKKDRIITVRRNNDSAEDVEISDSSYIFIRDIVKFHKADEKNEKALVGFEKLALFIRSKDGEEVDFLRKVAPFYSRSYKDGQKLKNKIIPFLTRFAADKAADDVWKSISTGKRPDSQKSKKEVLEKFGCKFIGIVNGVWRLKKIGDVSDSWFELRADALIKDLIRKHFHEEDLDNIGLEKLTDFIKSDIDKNLDFLNKVCEFYQRIYRFKHVDKSVALEPFIAEFAAEDTVENILLGLVEQHRGEDRLSTHKPLSSADIGIIERRKEVLNKFGFELLEKGDATISRMLVVKRCYKAGKGDDKFEIKSVLINDIVRNLANDAVSIEFKLGLEKLSAFVKYNNHYDLFRMICEFYNGNYCKSKDLNGKIRIELFLEEFAKSEDVENVLLRMAEDENNKYSTKDHRFKAFHIIFNKEKPKELKAKAPRKSRSLAVYNYVGYNTPLSHENSLVLARFVYTSSDFGEIFSEEEYDRCDPVKYVAYSHDDSLDDFLYKVVKDFANSEERFLPVKLCNGRVEILNGVEQIIGNTHVTGLCLEKKDDGSIALQHMNSLGNAVPAVIRRIVDKMRKEKFNLQDCEVVEDCSKQDDGYSCAYHAEYNLLQRYRAFRGLAPLNISIDDFIAQSKAYLQQKFNDETLPGCDETEEQRWLIKQVNDCLNSEESSIAKLVNLVAIKNEFTKKRIPQQSINAFFISALQKCLTEEYVAGNSATVTEELQKVMAENPFLGKLYEWMTFKSSAAEESKKTAANNSLPLASPQKRRVYNQAGHERDSLKRKTAASLTHAR